VYVNGRSTAPPTVSRVRVRIEAREGAADRVDPPARGRHDRLHSVRDDLAEEAERVAADEQARDARADEPEERRAPERSVVHEQVVARGRVQVP
jgi:hypothetical protein